MDIVIGILQKPAVKGQDVEQVEVLPFVLVQAFDVHIENGLGVDFQMAQFRDDRSELLFVAPFGLHETPLKFLVVGKFFQSAQFIQVNRPVATDGFVDQLGQVRVAGLEPATRRNAVGFVIEFAGIKLMEGGE